MVIFQSTLPVRGATSAPKMSTMYESFQSTLPVRGATASSYQLTAQAGISIHAPRAGSDLACIGLSTGIFHFNPRSPCGERLRTSRH